ncbi:DUF885 family protein [Crossiella sp. CA198]|uniref:DUF885 family protein n=1 Tax=Crossiella sp. CA198 TaxID=3455607 RepID=UPI003F8D42A5
MNIHARLRAVHDLSMPRAREVAGLHEYDGRAQDLSAAGVRRGLTTLGQGDRAADSDDEIRLRAAEQSLRVRLGDLARHRSDPLLHVANLDLAGYEREYASAGQRRTARQAHLWQWPDAVAVAIETLDRVTAPAARAACPAARGLAALIRDDDHGAGPARAAIARLVAHLDAVAGQGEPAAALGGPALTRLLAADEAIDVNLTELAERADAERHRVRALLDESCRRIDPLGSTKATMKTLLADRPTPDQLPAWTRATVLEVLEWAAGLGLPTDGTCLVGLVPPSQPWQVATMTAAAPAEPDGPSWFRVNPGDPSWSAAQRRDWLSMFARHALPVIALHEVAPGHFTHGRALREATTEVRRTLIHDGFSEGWAHYVEELALEEGFRGGDPRFAAAVARDALLRVTRMACVIGLHTGTMTQQEAVQRFKTDAFLAGPAAEIAANRVVLNPTGICYTWGKLLIRDLRERARQEWGAGFSLRRFHTALLGLGSPPLGLLGTALRAG